MHAPSRETGEPDSTDDLKCRQYWRIAGVRPTRHSQTLSVMRFVGTCGVSALSRKVAVGAPEQHRDHAVNCVPRNAHSPTHRPRSDPRSLPDHFGRPRIASLTTVRTTKAGAP